MWNLVTISQSQTCPSHVWDIAKDFNDSNMFELLDKLHYLFITFVPYTVCTAVSHMCYCEWISPHPSFDFLHLLQPLCPKELWHFVHQCYGNELGLTSDDEDYVPPDDDFNTMGYVYKKTQITTATILNIYVLRLHSPKERTYRACWKSYLGIIDVTSPLFLLTWSPKGN